MENEIYKITILALFGTDVTNDIKKMIEKFGFDITIQKIKDSGFYVTLNKYL